MRYFSILLLLILLNCKSTANANRNLVAPGEKYSLWSISGWNINPEIISKGEVPLTILEKDWFYMVAPGKALPRAVELNSPTFMQSSCKISAVKENQNQLFKEAIISSNPKWKDSPEIENKIKEIFDNNVPGSISCKPTGEQNSFNSCECLIYVMYKGGKESLSKFQ